MLKYEERLGTDCFKWDGIADMFGEDGLLPLWVADMDFRVDEHIIDAINEYLAKGIPGYYKIPDSYHQSFINWEQEEHGLAVKREWIRFSPGVVAGFNIALNVVTEPGDAVIINTPVYYPFSNAVKNNNRKLVTSELVNKGGRYYIDFEDFENKIKSESVKAFILCSPHNPVSRVWSREELQTILDICSRNDVILITDEIHHDLVFGDAVHIPTLSLADDMDRIIMFTAASKSFNIAGLQNSFAVIANAELRKQWDEFTGGLFLRNGNALGYIATEAAYRYGKPWLEEVKAAIYSNYELIRDTFAKELPLVKMTPLEGTYLAWADFGAYLKPEEIEEFMQGRCKLAFDYGSWFGGDGSGSFIRINLATSRENIEEMLKRITGVMSIQCMHEDI